MAMVSIPAVFFLSQLPEKGRKSEKDPEKVRQSAYFVGTETIPCKGFGRPTSCGESLSPRKSCDPNTSAMMDRRKL